MRGGISSLAYVGEIIMFELLKASLCAKGYQDDYLQPGSEVRTFARMMAIGSRGVYAAFGICASTWSKLCFLEAKATRGCRTRRSTPGTQVLLSTSEDSLAASADEEKSQRPHKDTVRKCLESTMVA